MDRALSALSISKLRGKSSKDLAASFTASKEFPADPACYELLEDCGRGVSATVHRAFVVETGEEVAVKKMNLERVNMSLEEIIHEAQTMKSYHHKNVLPLYTSFVHGQDLWMVTPFMSGGSVLHIMKYQYPDGLEEPVIATIMKAVLEGLAYVHENRGIHRDVKAGNILIDRDGSVRIGDFGVAATLQREGSWGNEAMTRTTFVGTPCWMAPEVMEQTDSYNSAADIWSFGITMLELANGHAPFAKFPPMKVLLMTLQNPPPQLDDKQGRKHFSKAMRNLVARCLQKDHKQRPSARELLDDKFFKQARDAEFLQRTLVLGLPALGERVQQIRVGKAATLAAENDKQLEKSQEEYVKGVSAWNFNIEELRKQAELEPDDGSTPGQQQQAPRLTPIAEGPEPGEGQERAADVSVLSSRRSTDDAAAQPLTPPAVGLQQSAEQPAAVVQQQQVEQQQQQQAASQLPVQQQQQLQLQAPLDGSGSGAAAAAAQQQQQQQQGTMRRTASAFAGSPALAAAAAAAAGTSSSITSGSNPSNSLQAHFSEPAAVQSQQPAAAQQSCGAGMAPAAVGSNSGTGLSALSISGSGSSLSLASGTYNGSPPMSRESSSQGPLSSLTTPEAIPLKGKSKGRHGRFQVYEHGEEPPPMSPPAGRGMQESLTGSFTRSGLLSEGRMSDSATDTPRQVLAAAEAAELAAAAAAAAGCNGASVGFAVAAGDGAGGAAAVSEQQRGGGATAGISGSTTPTLAAAAAAAASSLAAGSAGLPPPAPSAGAASAAPGPAQLASAGGSLGIAGLAGGTVSEGTDVAGAAEPKKRGRFKIIEEEVPASRHASVSKVPSSADLGKSSRGLVAAASGAGLLAELLRLHEQAAAHQAGLVRLIDGVKASSSSSSSGPAGAPSAPAAVGDGDSAAAGSAGGVVRKLSATGSISRSTSSRALAGYPELARVSVGMLLPAYDNDAAELAERLLERGQDLERRAADNERRLADVLEENRVLRRQLGLHDVAAPIAAAAAGPVSADGAGDGSRGASRRASSAAHALTTPAAVGAAAAGGPAAGGAAAGSGGLGSGTAPQAAARTAARPRRSWAGAVRAAANRRLRVLLPRVSWLLPQGCQRSCSSSSVACVVCGVHGTVPA
ncbi:hypothetical protein COO60DRAFT_266714 [Scenedesmus sp. NREL 46B-D3]|nr:hypothetical protein COO60DRAFT_266714 [Scenedesmus sp. NREL 46B-D3]